VDRGRLGVGKLETGRKEGSETRARRLGAAGLRVREGNDVSVFSKKVNDKCLRVDGTIRNRYSMLETENVVG
jgi:hypothetical protein